MANVSFNAKAICIAHNTHNCDMSHALIDGPHVPIVARNKPLFERLGFTNVKHFVAAADEPPAKQVDR